MLKIGLVGAGDWGKNLIRIFHQLRDARLACCCDLDLKRRETVTGSYPGVKVTARFEDILEDASVGAVVICSSAVTHYPLTMAALKAGKHVYVEKPLALGSAQAEEMKALAERMGLKLMVGHLLLYHPAVKILKELVESGDLGQVFYIYSQRVNLGKIRHDENALWSFAPHDISVILHLLGQEPVSVSARGESYLQQGIEDVVFVNMKFADHKMAQLQVSWLDPHKVRKITIVGSKKMVVFDDVESTEKLKIFDKGVSGVSYESYGDSITLRFGDISIPYITMTEPLRVECQHFVDCVLKDRRPLTDGEDGVRVVRVLEAAQHSMENDGKPISLEMSPPVGER
ncbi:MAG: gfo/Idh/MocA family oxidoreductase [Candidatus Abyssobacteria bacterium SURF_5]|uniref:Gfo/Idh/MocA family oxidoreductase n=1 Tax=Abyssobacteria bacterium (strain SURF_5) TaxID=2093360 RepID=A0A3A4NZE7_ABYX5|nr:MAG: gfo/Idh/MocA family oxidoreductase [Candidatus Abyssubacteria bacterium SURF_5]